MKKAFYTILMFAGIATLAACSNGDYIANPSGNTNNGVNPLNPLKADEFTWSGEAPLSADINGTHWKATSFSFAVDTSGANVIRATSGNKTMYFRLADVWGGNLYDMQFNNSKRYSSFYDSSNSAGGMFYSNLGNSGGISLVENDTAYIVAKFYYKGVSASGQAISVTNGYMKLRKP